MINERSPKWAGLCVAAYWAHPRLHKTRIYLYCTRDTPSEVFLQWRTWHVVCIRRRRTKAWSEWKHSIGIKGKQIFYMSYAIFVHVVFFFFLLLFCHFKLCFFFFFLLVKLEHDDNHIWLFLLLKGSVIWTHFGSFHRPPQLWSRDITCSHLLDIRVTVFYVTSGICLTLNKCFFCEWITFVVVVTEKQTNLKTGALVIVSVVFRPYNRFTSTHPPVMIRERAQ